MDNFGIYVGQNGELSYDKIVSIMTFDDNKYEFSIQVNKKLDSYDDELNIRDENEIRAHIILGRIDINIFKRDVSFDMDDTFISKTGLVNICYGFHSYNVDNKEYLAMITELESCIDDRYYEGIADLHAKIAKATFKLRSILVDGNMVIYNDLSNSSISGTKSSRN